MLIVGLTGNIGSGKSTVANIFRILGIPVYHADAESKLLLDSELVIIEVTRTFGKEILNPEGIVNRQLLANIVFNEDAALEKLNRILHPKVKEHFSDWVKIQTTNYVVQEAAILFESGFSSIFDKIITVSCPVEQAIERVIQRDDVSIETILNRMRHQIPDEKKSAMADFVIKNDGQHLVIPQVLSIHNRLSEICA